MLKISGRRYSFVDDSIVEVTVDLLENELMIEHEGDMTTVYVDGWVTLTVERATLKVEIV